MQTESTEPNPVKLVTGSDRQLLEGIYALVSSIGEKLTGQHPVVHYINGEEGHQHIAIQKVEWLGEPRPDFITRAIRFVEQLSANDAPDRSGC